MATFRIQFEQIALFVHQPAGAYVIFPRTKHDVTFGVEGGAFEPLTGLATVQVTRDGAPIIGTVGRADDRVPHLGTILPGTPRPLSIEKALKKSAAVLWLPTGSLKAEDPIGDTAPYTKAKWTIGSARETELTNCVTWSASGDSAVLLATNLARDLKGDAPLIIRNADSVKRQEYPADELGVYLDEFRLHYEFVSGHPHEEGEGPMPRTAKRAERQPALTSLTPMTPFTPLCPPAQI